MTYCRIKPGPAEVILARHILTYPASIRSYDVPINITTFKYTSQRAGLRKVKISAYEVIYLITDEAEVWAWDVVNRHEHGASPAERAARRRKIASQRKLSRCTQLA